MTVGGGILGEREFLARGDAELLGDDVDAGDDLGDGVLDLDAGVDLEEGDGAVLRDDVLDGAGAGVADLLADGAGALDDALALGVSEPRGRGLLDELLEAALRGAVARAEHDDVAVGIRDDLGLDVARVGEEFLDVALGAAEGLAGLAAGGVEGALDGLEIVDDLEAASAAAVGRLNRDGEAVLLRELSGLLPVVDGVRGTRRQRGADLLGDAAGRNLVAEQVDGVRRGADPGQAGAGDGAGELGVLRQEAVARVDGVRASAHRDIEDGGDVHVRIRRGVARQGVGLVRDLRVQGTGVGLGVDGDGLHAKVAGGARNTHGDLAAVGDEHGLNLHVFTSPQSRSGRGPPAGAGPRYQCLLLVPSPRRGSRR